MLIDIPDENDFYIAAENLINSAWSSLTKLLEDHVVFEDIEAEETAKDKYWIYAKPELTAAAAMVQHAVEFYLKAKILSISPYLLIASEPRAFPRKSDSKDVSFTEFRTLDAQDLLKVLNTFSSERLGEDFKQWFGNMRLMRNKIMHTVDNNLSIKPSELAVAILQGHEYLVGKNSWIKSRTSFLNRSPEHGVKIGSTKEHDAYIHLAIHRELSLVINSLSPLYAIKFFKYDEISYSETCTTCYEIFSHCDFFDCKWTDSFVQTLQRRAELHEEMECIVCGVVAAISKVGCQECGNFSINSSTRECLWCAINL
ncbi:MAG: hypothetical protein GYB38_03550 [Gammaproteobacteria bacterium]|nr:hypothetical protein [Gammaproteobacteria bacterium]